MFPFDQDPVFESPHVWGSYSYVGYKLFETFSVVGIDSSSGVEGETIHGKA